MADQVSAGYDEHDTERLVDAPSRAGRLPFERDRARIVHSAALRRLAAKTQVVGPQSNDFVRNRLTHTLEVAQIGRETARVLGCDPDLVEAACLAHDLGHPPYGHNGERALDEVAHEIGGFEGNAQTFRLLTRLEPKSFDDAGHSVGLNLTRATLDAASKYPWPLADAAQPSGRHGDGLPRSVRKFGVYDDDLAVFTWMRAGRPAGQVCLEAQVMDFADDVAYSVHDVEDGVVAGRVDLADLAGAGLRAEVWATVREWYAPDADDELLEAALARVSALSAWPISRYDGGRPNLARLKNLTSQLINRFCRAVRDAVAADGSTYPRLRYSGDLPVPAQVREEIAVLKGIAAHLVMRADDRMALLAEQRAVLTELTEVMVKTGEPALDPLFRADFTAAANDEQRLRVVVDQVASLTDSSAVHRHRALVRGA